MRYLVGLLLVTVLAGCAGTSASGGVDTGAAGPQVTTPAGTGCEAFQTFLTDLEVSGPQAQAQLVADVQAVQSGASGQLLTDATDLAGFVGSSSWVSSGSVDSPRVQKVQADCP